MKKEDQRIILTKRLLREGLLRILENSADIDKISITELCAEAGINRTTFYKHYSSPRDVLADIEKNITSDLKNIIDSICPDEPIILRLEAICSYLYKNSDMVKTLIKCNSDSYLEKKFAETQRSLCELNSTFNHERKLDSDSIRLVSAFLTSGSYNLIRIWLTEGISKTPSEIAALILGMFTSHNDLVN